ncbi:hypothetical protein D9M68_687370 [compost metagenome]
MTKICQRNVGKSQGIADLIRGKMPHLCQSIGTQIQQVSTYRLQACRIGTVLQVFNNMIDRPVIQQGIALVVDALCGHGQAVGSTAKGVKQLL